MPNVPKCNDIITTWTESCDGEASLSMNGGALVLNSKLTSQLQILQTRYLWQAIPS